jgi:hypothetical protein
LHEYRQKPIRRRILTVGSKKCVTVEPELNANQLALALSEQHVVLLQQIDTRRRTVDTTGMVVRINSQVGSHGSIVDHEQSCERRQEGKGEFGLRHVLLADQQIEFLVGAIEVPVAFFVGIPQENVMTGGASTRAHSELWLKSELPMIQG